MRQSILVLALLGVGLLSCSTPVQKVDKYAVDCTTIRGFNYTPATVAEPRHHVDTWVKYDESVIDFDLNLAQGLKLNMARVFVPYQCFTELGDTLTTRLRDFAKRCEARGIGFVPVVGSGRWTRDSTLLYQADEWVDFLVAALKDEPSLMMWDLMNEPDLNRRMKESNFENCKLMYRLFKEKDPDTPLTIGMEKVSCMIEMADYADILQFHNYSETRDMVRDTIAKAKAFAASVGKQVFNGEMGCIARANPYDVTLEEHMKADMGWCIWELMIVEKTVPSAILPSPPPSSAISATGRIHSLISLTGRTRSAASSPVSTSGRKTGRRTSRQASTLQKWEQTCSSRLSSPLCTKLRHGRSSS